MQRCEFWIENVDISEALLCIWMDMYGYVWIFMMDIHDGYLIQYTKTDMLYYVPLEAHIYP